MFLAFRRRPLALAALVCLFVQTVSADLFDGVRASIRKQLIADGAPSIAVAVAKDGKIVWEQGFGWADRENRVPAGEHTMYSLASISKPITATGLMVLAGRGKIDLDRAVNDYLGEAKLRGRAGAAEGATVRRVANHTSGLPLHYQFFYADEPYRRPPMDITILRYGNLVTAPGEKYEYSNLGYGVLDYVISRVSGKSYSEFMRTEVFEPLGLTHTSVDIGPGLERYQAIRYGADGSPLPFYDFDHPGASAIYSSAHDLIRFAMFHLKSHLEDQRPILTDQAIDAMQKETAKSGETSGYGIGWSVSHPAEGYRVVSHTGGMGGVSTTLRLIPSENLAVAVLSNAASTLPHRISDEILRTMLPEWKGAPGPASSRARSAALPKELLGTWEGRIHTYADDLPLTLRFLESGDVHAQIGHQLKVLLNDVRWQDGFVRGRMLGDIGTEDAGRRPYFLALSMKLRGSILNGSATAMSASGKRVGNALTHWVELTKK